LSVQITSSKWQEVITNSKGQEARSKKSRSNYKQQGVRSKTQEVRKQEEEEEEEEEEKLKAESCLLFPLCSRK